jgi:hypothetical protein
MLGPLADNGGTTQTHALLAGSLAIDAGDNTSCPQTDQRGLKRPLDGDFNGTAICDIGAIEFYQYAISGRIVLTDGTPIEDVLVSADNRGGFDTTDSDGFYELFVPANWSGAVTPTKLWYALKPDSQIYTEVTNDLSGQDYTGRILPQTPMSITPGDGTIITSLTPTFKWSVFQDGGDGDSQTGYQIQVIFKNQTVYDTGFIPDISGHSHTYQPPGTYSGYDSVADTNRTSEPLEYGKHYHWRVRYLDSGDDWSKWNNVDSRQDFNIYAIAAGDIFVPYQEIATNGATDWESFTIDNDTFLAVANYGAWDYDRRYDSVIYKWNGSGFIEFQRIETFRALDFEAFTIGNDTFLAVANLFHHVYSDNSVIYKWNGSRFEEFQFIHTAGNEWKSFTIGTDTFLAVSKYGSPSIIYQWNGNAFVQYQGISKYDAQGMEIFTIGSDIFLAVAGLDYNSIIYKWNGSSFDMFQKISINGALDWESFVILENTFLAMANFYHDESIIFKWDGSAFIEYQSIPTNGAYDWERFVIGPHTYLAVANRNDDSVIYRWNGSMFVAIQSIATHGAFDWESFSIGTDLFLAIANHFDDTTTKISPTNFALETIPQDAFKLRSLVLRLNSAQIYKGDFNGDGAVTYDDFYDVFQPAYGTHEGDPDFISECDMNQDGSIDMLDYTEWYSCYMEANPQ